MTSLTLTSNFNSNQAMVMTRISEMRWAN